MDIFLLRIINEKGEEFVASKLDRVMSNEVWENRS